MTGPGPPVGRLIAAAQDRLREAGIESPAADAEWLLAHVLDLPRGRLRLTAPPTAAERAAFDDLVRRRAEREPLQYLLGRAAFRHLDLLVGPGVFVPRPETELLIDLVRAGLAGVPRPVVVDLCAGSGALGLAVADEFGRSTVVLVERSPAALVWLRANVAGSAASGRVRDVTADVGDASLTAPGGALEPLRSGVDLVLSNPPYVPAATPVGPEVGHDPPEAVFAGPDGMAVIVPVVARAGELLRVGGTLGLEHDETHQARVLDLLTEDGRWGSLTAHPDLAGRARFVTARRRATAGR